MGLLSIVYIYIRESKKLLLMFPFPQGGLHMLGEILVKGKKKLGQEDVAGVRCSLEGGQEGGIVPGSLRN